jgi:UDP-N-acetyl-D-mannosaminuronic acid dehydrogenase
MFKTISVIGLGYIGLPTAAVFASRKINVIGVDVNQTTVDTINEGEIHIVEPDLDIVVKAAVTEGYLKATTVPEPADAFLIAVPTPFKENHKPDLSFIEAAARNIAPILKKGDLIVLESTSPVGATEKLAAWLADERKDLSFPPTAGDKSDINISHCPERVLPGHVMRELIENDRIIGGLSKKCSDRSVELYKIFVQGECIVTDARTAEMAKLTENASRDVSIAFANELSIICDQLDIDVWELIDLSNRHPRVNILKPGAGVGGHCIAVDPWFIVSKTPEIAPLIHTARKVNDAKPKWLINKVKIAIADFLLTNSNKRAEDVTVACYGLAFKPDIDDLRESPALAIVKEICMFHSGSILVVEPNIAKIPKELGVANLVGVRPAIENADVHVILVGHREFKCFNGLEGLVVDAVGIA